MWGKLKDKQYPKDDLDGEADPVGLFGGFIHKYRKEPHGSDGEIGDAEHLVGLLSAEDEDRNAETDKDSAKDGTDFRNAARTRGFKPRKSKDTARREQGDKSRYDGEADSGNLKDLEDGHGFLHFHNLGINTGVFFL